MRSFLMRFVNKVSNRRDSRETFDSIFLDLSKQPGRCRFADSGLGWKPSGGGDTFTLDRHEIFQAQWSRAARGYEIKIYSRSGDVIQLDGFHEEVWPHYDIRRIITAKLTKTGL
jgi:POB3-like N-terminal PH domain